MEELNEQNDNIINVPGARKISVYESYITKKI